MLRSAADHTADDTETDQRHRTDQRHPTNDTPTNDTGPTNDTEPATKSTLLGDADPISPWATPAQNMAAVEIWEMVDEMLADEQTASELVTAGGPPEQRGGRWRRGKKG